MVALKKNHHTAHKKADVLLCWKNFGHDSPRSPADAAKDDSLLHFKDKAKILHPFHKLSRDALRYCTIGSCTIDQPALQAIQF